MYVNTTQTQIVSRSSVTNKECFYRDEKKNYFTKEYNAIFV